LAHYIHHLLEEGNISLDDNICNIDFDQADHQKVADMIENNVLGLNLPPISYSITTLIELGGEMLMKIPKPVYKRIQIELPTPPGVEPLPPFIYFDVDTRLSEARVREVILRLIAAWQAHYIETAADGTSDLAACSLKYATQNLTPVLLNYTREQSITNGEEALEFAMDILTSFFWQNGLWKAPFPKIDYANSSSDVFEFSKDGECEFGVPLDVTMNA
jgi:hypothetical protein